MQVYHKTVTTDERAKSLALAILSKCVGVSPETILGRGVSFLKTQGNCRCGETTAIQAEHVAAYNSFFYSPIICVCETCGEQ